MAVERGGEGVAEANGVRLSFPLRISLSEGALVASGSTRQIYEHPAFPGLLIKVFRPNRITPAGDFISHREKGWRKLRRRLGAHRITARELGEHLAFHARHAASWRMRPFSAMVGVVDTDQGMGLLVERLADPSGALAPTLRSMLRAGPLSAAHRRALEEFFAALERWQVCVNDLHTGNIVLVSSSGEAPRFAAVDGIGLRSAIPVQDWFPRINAMQVRKRARRVWAAVEQAAAASMPETVAQPSLNLHPSAS